MFQFPGFLSLFRDDSLSAAGFPHSDTDGSLPPYGWPSHFAVWRVLLQYSVARHPPCALPCLIFSDSLKRFSCFLRDSFSELFFHCSSNSSFLSISPQLYFRPSVVFHIVVWFSKIAGRHSSKTGQQTLLSFLLPCTFSLERR